MIKIILETKDITKQFGGLIAVNNVSLKIEEGEIFGLIGPNGAGKTTFVNVITGVYEATAGNVYFKGEDITNEVAPYQLCAKGMARTYQIVKSFPKMTVLENVETAVVFGNSKKYKTEERAREILDFVGFPLDYNTKANKLNTIYLKYLELARALATDPDLLFLDELGAGLTPGELQGFMDMIRKIRDQGITILAIEHVMEFIMNICDRIAVLETGKKIAVGTPEEISNNDEVIEAYLGEEI